MARNLGDQSLADKAKALINGDMVLLARAGDRDVDLRVSGWQPWNFLIVNVYG
jgi:hypothetical protein